MLDEHPPVGATRPSRKGPLVVGLVILLAYLPAVQAPLAMTDDHDLFMINGLTREQTSPMGIRAFMEDDITRNGRFRPVLVVERFALARLLGPRPALFRWYPILIAIATAMVLMRLGGLLGMGGAGAGLLALLVVLNPRGCEIYYAIAPSERMALLCIAVALVATVRAAGADRGWRWEVAAVVFAALAALAKEPFVLVLPAVAATRLSMERLRHDRPWKQALRRTAPLAVSLALLGVVILAFILHAYSYRGYSAGLMGTTTLAKGFRRVLRHAFQSNAYLLPVGIFFVVQLLHPDPRFRALRVRVLVVMLVALLWLVPTMGLQVIIGSARGRWIFPLAVPLAFVNAMAFDYLWGRAAKSGRAALGAAMGLWILIAWATCLGSTMTYRAQSKLLARSLEAIYARVPNGGAVLLATDGIPQYELVLSLNRFFHGQGRGDIILHVVDLPGSASVPDPARRREMLSDLLPSYCRIVSDPVLTSYDAVVALPLERPAPPGLFDGSDGQGERLEIAESCPPLKIGDPWMVTHRTHILFP
jgi:hypothetical protein